MANEITQDTILAKKIDNYGFCNSNFVAPGEITVTITLNEYRELLATSATTKNLVNAAENDKYSRDAENKSLKEENSTLKAEVYKLKNIIDGNIETSEGVKNT